MDTIIILRINKETNDKLEYLFKYLKGIYPSKSQVIRSAIHRLHKEKLKEEINKQYQILKAKREETPRGGL